MNPSSYTIQGGLPWSGGGASGDYASAYNAALSMNQQNYNNILAGYQQTLGNQVQAQNQISQGYNQLASDVRGTIAGVGGAQQQAINDQYAQAAGQATQDLVNRGLGNTTVQSSVLRGYGLDRAKAQVALGDQMAQLQAGYQSQLGLAGLNYQNQAAMQATGQANQQLGWMNSVNAAYPDVGQYANLAMQAGAAQQNRDLQNRLMTQPGLPPGGFTAGYGGASALDTLGGNIDWGSGGSMYTGAGFDAGPPPGQTTAAAYLNQSPQSIPGDYYGTTYGARTPYTTGYDYGAGAGSLLDSAMGGAAPAGYAAGYDVGSGLGGLFGGYDLSDAG